MKLAPLLLALTLAASAQTQFTDPANLRGERVQPRDGRELPIDQGASGLEQLLRKLNTRASIMNIVAHPDDEDGGMLTLYSRGLGARVADLSLNRGEGGQNAMTADFEDALGLLRTQELLASDRYTGVDQFFGTEVDFGFSKTKEEAFAKWGHDRVLYDVVRAIRLYRPLVLTSTWIGGVTDGHGQHQVSGQIAQEAFLAAGDPKVFPELTAEGILPWQPLRIYARVPRQSITEKGLYDYATNQYVPASFTNYVTGEVTTTAPTTDIVVHEGTPDPLLDGKTYVQFARLGLAQQKSQVNPNDRPAPTGTYDVPYHLYGHTTPRNMASVPSGPHETQGFSRGSHSLRKNAGFSPEDMPSSHEPNFFTGIDTSVESIATLAPNAPLFLSRELARMANEIQTATLNFDPKDVSKVASPLRDGLKICDDLIARMASAVMDYPEKASVLHELRIKRVQLNDALLLADQIDFYLEPTEELQGKDKPILTTDKHLEVPIEFRNGQEQEVNYLGGRLLLAQGSASAITTPVSRFPDDPLVGRSERIGQQLKVDLPHGLPATRPYFSRPNIEQPFYDLNRPDLRNAPSTPDPVIFELAFEDKGVKLFRQMVLVHFTGPSADQPQQIVPPPSSKETYVSIGYGDLPRTIYYPRPKPQLHNTGLKLPARHHIAYLPGTGDAVPDALASIGLTPTVLTVADLTADKLKPFDTVILGVRTYAAHPDLHGAPTQALLGYARNGGNVVVQYQTPEFTAADAPYPLSLGSNEKVVDETAPVQLLDAKAPLLTTPNRLTPADFNGWVEERGHGFLATWDDHYSALTETHDPGQSPQRGGLITTSIGKGRWTYVAFALYRQLPEAVPGAFRLFANLLNP